MRTRVCAYPDLAAVSSSSSLHGGVGGVSCRIMSCTYIKGRCVMARPALTAAARWQHGCSTAAPQRYKHVPTSAHMHRTAHHDTPGTGPRCGQVRTAWAEEPSVEPLASPKASSSVSQPEMVLNSPSTLMPTFSATLVVQHSPWSIARANACNTDLLEVPVSC